jgi:hypothetical protein
MNKIQTYDSKYEYLESKLKIEECDNFCTEYSVILKKNIMCGKCFWRNVTLPYDMIPECSICKKDMENFKNKFNEGISSINMQLECSIHCLWYDWFDSKRQLQAKQAKIKLIYTKKEDKLNDNKNKKELQDKENINNKNKEKDNNKNNKHNKHNKNNKHNKHNR